MILYPAMDLMGGRCVRLKQGRFEEASVYSADPAGALARFADAGAAWAHVVDLDGARAGEPVQHELIAGLARRAPLKLQVAGGFRSRAQVARMFEAGAGRIVIGSLAVSDAEAVLALVGEYGADAITLALDVKLEWGVPVVVTNGWSRGSGRTIYDLAAAFLDARHLLVTDVGRDGMMRGPNLQLFAELVQIAPGFSLQASGGIAGLDDLRNLAAAGTAGAVIGRALWEGKIDLGEAIEHACA